MVRYLPKGKGFACSGFVCSGFVCSSKTVAAMAIGVLLYGAELTAFASPATPVIAAVNKQQSPNAEATNRLPLAVSRQVRRDLAQRLNVPRRQLSVISYSRQTWSDSCLGLGTAAESCAQALVPGWQIELTDGEQSWVYRTDETAQTMRLQEPVAQADNASFPGEVGDRILKAASEDSDLPKSELTIIAAQPHTWDGCLGIASVDAACTTIAIAGWQVIVAGETGSWIYHSNENGSEIRLNETASTPSGTVIPGFISADQFPPYSEQGVVFKAIVEGGITGSSSKILLLEDGQVVQFADDQGVSTATELNHLSPAQVQAFTELLRQQLFSNLSGLNYPAPTGAADYRTITLVSQSGTVRYADIVQDQLPSALQQVIQAWEQTIAK